jgi:hypothetical protein
MSKIGNFVIEVQEYVWDFFDGDGNFVADEVIKTKEDMIVSIKNKFGYMGVDIAEEVMGVIEVDTFIGPY